jgi:hypothetical protein
MGSQAGLDRWMVGLPQSKRLRENAGIMPLPLTEWFVGVLPTVLAAK